MLLRSFLTVTAFYLCVGAAAQYVETDHLIGVHFFADQNANGGVAANPIYTDVERLLGDTGGPEGSTTFNGDGGGWLLDFVATDVDAANSPFYQWAWQGGAFGATDKTAPGYMTYAFRRATQGGKRHSPIVRIQPAYGRNVPYDAARWGLPGPGDPYTVMNFASDCRLVANLLKDTARYYVLGNEVNFTSENGRFSGVNGGLNEYNNHWSPTPEQYADMYLAVRDTMITATAGSAGTPKLLLQPVTPSAADGGSIFMDGYEYLWRMIKHINSVDPNKLDGFALHAYAEPGGPDYGNEGYWASLQEQLSIIGQLGHANKPVFITEFNKHMPNETEHQVAVQFVKRAYQTMNAWNSGTGGMLPGLANQNITGTTWFVYPSSGANLTDGWNEYSLAWWKDKTALPTADNNIWYSFNSVAMQRYPRGAYGGGTPWPAAKVWWSDSFGGSSIDTAPGLADWIVSTAGGGTAAVANGKASFSGNGNRFGMADVRMDRGWLFGDFSLEAAFTFADANKSASDSPEANFDVQIRTRQGLGGYSLTFFSTPSPDRPGHIVLRRTGTWETIGSFDAIVPGGINTGDMFRMVVRAEGTSLRYKVYKNGGATPVVDWDVTDNVGPKFGYVRLGSYAISQVDLDYVAMAGLQWPAGFAGAVDWALFD